MVDMDEIPPLFKCIKYWPGIDPMSIRYCRAAGTDVCDRDCGVYRSREIKEHKPADSQEQDSI